MLPAEKWTIDRDAQAQYGIEWIEGVNDVGLSEKPGRIFTGGNSGYQAIGLAWQWGATRIILLGFDMQKTGGAAHWHGNHPKALGDPHSAVMEQWVTRFEVLARDIRSKGVEILNTTRSTALQCFPKVDLMQVLNPPRFFPLVVQGMHGMGDNLHQRAVIQHLMQTKTVWLETPWPCLYHDLVGDRLKLITKGSALRTQAKNAAREAARFDKGRPPYGSKTISVSYPPDMVRKHGSVLEAMSAQVGVPVGNFSLPIYPEWADRAEKLIAEWQPSKPLMIYRPLVERTEWGGCKNRNPDVAAYAALFHAVRDRFFVVSVADLVPGKEWEAGDRVDADIEFHAGEMDIEVLAGLVSKAALVYTAPGFAVILAQAVGTPSVCVFGGYENSSSFVGGAHMAPYLGIDPVVPCKCFSHTHACRKEIDMSRATQRLLEFVDAHCPQPTINQPVAETV